MKISKKELLTIPNIMGYIRLILIPVFIILYLTDHFMPAVIALAVSILTDFFDGIVARKCHQITELGKLLDPVADKLTQASVVVCLAFCYSLLWPVFVIEFIKESFMMIAGAITIRKLGRKLDGAKWYGKIGTAITDFVLLFLLAFPTMPQGLANGLIIFCGLCMVITLLGYISEYHSMWHKTAA